VYYGRRERNGQVGQFNYHQPLAGFQGPISKGKGGEGKDIGGKGKGGERREGKEEMEREFGQVGQLYYCAPPAPSWISGAYF